MKKENLFKMIGPLIYILTYPINKFIIEVANIVYIAVTIIGSGFLLSGVILSQRN